MYVTAGEFAIEKLIEAQWEDKNGVFFDLCLDIGFFVS